MVKIHVYDTDPRFTNEPDYHKSRGSFGEAAFGINEGLRQIGHYAEPDDADFVGSIDGLNLGFKYKNKKSFIINCWETDSLTQQHLDLYNHFKPILFGLSDFVSNLWRGVGIPCETVYPVLLPFWRQEGNRDDVFTFLHVAFSNVRSGIDLVLEANRRFCQKYPHFQTQLIIKNTTDSVGFNNIISQYINSYGLKIEYINKRVSNDEMRDLYNRSHVCINLYRGAGFGLPIMESVACGCIPIIGGAPPMNEILTDDPALTVPVSDKLKIKDCVPELEKTWGLTNHYPLNFDWITEPHIYNYDVNDIVRSMSHAYTYRQMYMHTLNIHNRITHVRNTFNPAKRAQVLVDNLQKYVT